MKISTKKCSILALLLAGVGLINHVYNWNGEFQPITYVLIFVFLSNVIYLKTSKKLPVDESN